MRKITLVLLIMSLGQIGLAQMAGYAGKRFLVRADVLEGRYAAFSGVGLEYIINRKFSLTLGYKNFDSKVSQEYMHSEYPYSGGASINDKADISTRAFELEGRIYHINPMSLPAPDGFFNYINYRWGVFNVNSGNYWSELVEQPLPSGGSEYVTYTYENVDFWTLELGLGLQKLINKWVTVGGKFGMNYTKINPETHEEFNTAKVVSGVAQQYGSNLFSIPRISTDAHSTGSNVGFSLTLQVGILIY